MTEFALSLSGNNAQDKKLSTTHHAVWEMKVPSSLRLVWESFLLNLCSPEAIPKDLTYANKLLQQVPPPPLVSLKFMYKF